MAQEILRLRRFCCFTERFGWCCPLLTVCLSDIVCSLMHPIVLFRREFEHRFKGANFVATVQRHAIGGELRKSRVRSVAWKVQHIPRRSTLPVRHEWHMTSC